MELPVGMLSAMNEVIIEENRAQRRAQARAKAARG